jgi:hypothetical protein
VSAYDNDPRVRANADGTFTLSTGAGCWKVRRSAVNNDWVAERSGGVAHLVPFTTADEAIAAVIGEPQR